MVLFLTLTERPPREIVNFMQDVIAEIISFKNGILELLRQDTNSYIVLMINNYDYIEDKLKKGTIIKVSYTKKQKVSKISFIKGGVNGY